MALVIAECGWSSDRQATGDTTARVATSWEKSGDNSTGPQFQPQCNFLHTLATSLPMAFSIVRYHAQITYFRIHMDVYIELKCY